MLNARARTASRTLTSEFAWIVAASLLMAASAQIAVPVPFSPVPISGQTLGIPLVVALLGTRAATLSMVAYLVEGASGLPVFAAHHGGATWLIAAPSAGYLWSFPLAAFAIGWLLDHGLWTNAVGRFVAILLGTAIVFVCGTAWLAHFLGGIEAALAAGVYPFVVGDFVKVALAAIAAPAVARLGIGFTRR